jgi:hypothetical protein
VTAGAGCSGPYRRPALPPPRTRFSLAPPWSRGQTPPRTRSGVRGDPRPTHAWINRLAPMTRQLRRHIAARLHVALDRRPLLGQRQRQIVGRLQIEPEFRRRAEIARSAFGAEGEEFAATRHVTAAAFEEVEDRTQNSGFDLCRISGQRKVPDRSGAAMIECME